MGPGLVMALVMALVMGLAGLLAIGLFAHGRPHHVQEAHTPQR